MVVAYGNAWHESCNRNRTRGFEYQSETRTDGRYGRRPIKHRSGCFVTSAPSRCRLSSPEISFARNPTTMERQPTAGPERQLSLIFGISNIEKINCVPWRNSEDPISQASAARNVQIQVQVPFGSELGNALNTHACSRRNCAIMIE